MENEEQIEQLLLDAARQTVIDDKVSSLSCGLDIIESICLSDDNL